MSIEGTANTEYASLSGKIRTFVVDKTLTISGACADAKATGEAIEKNAGVAAEEYLNEALTPAVEAVVEAAVSGAYERLDVLEAQHTIEKITEITTSEDMVSSGFYIELPQTLVNYPVLIISATNVRWHPNSYTGHTGEIVAVESLTSTTALATLLELEGDFDKSDNSAAFFYPVKVDPTSVYINGETIKDTKYLYVWANTVGLAAGSHFEIWGAVK